MASLRRGHRCYVCLNLDRPTWDHKDIDILKKIDEGYYKLKHWFSFKDAAATALSGCNGCRILLEILRSDTSQVQGQAEGMLTGDVFLSRRETRIKMGVAYRIDHRLFGMRELRTTTGATGRCKNTHTRRELSPTTLSLAPLTALLLSAQIAMLVAAKRSQHSRGYRLR